MTRWLATPLAAVVLLGATDLHAQRASLPSLTSPSSFELLRSIGTAEEKPILDGATTRLKARYADATWVKRLGDALSQRRTEDARRLVLGAIQVPGSEAEFLYPGEALPLEDGPAGVAFQYAALRSGSTYTPWYFLVRTGWAFVMFCSTKGECKRGW